MDTKRIQKILQGYKRCHELELEQTKPDEKKERAKFLKELEDDIDKCLMPTECRVFDQVDCSQSFLTPHFCVFNAIQVHDRYGHDIYYGCICRNVDSCYPKETKGLFSLMEHCWNGNLNGQAIEFTLCGDLNPGWCYVGSKITREQAQAMIDSGYFRDKDNNCIVLKDMTDDEIENTRKTKRQRYFDYWNNID